MTLMSRIKVTPFLNMPYATQFDLVKNIQLLRDKALKEAPKKKVKVAKKKTVKKKKVAVTKALKSLDGMTIEQLMALAEKHNIKV